MFWKSWLIEKQVRVAYGHKNAISCLFLHWNLFCEGLRKRRMSGGGPGGVAQRKAKRRGAAGSSKLIKPSYSLSNLATAWLRGKSGEGGQLVQVSWFSPITQCSNWPKHGSEKSQEKGAQTKAKIRGEAGSICSPITHCLNWLKNGSEKKPREGGQLVQVSGFNPITHCQVWTQHGSEESQDKRGSWFNL
jgi:hypothetical protein